MTAPSPRPPASFGWTDNFKLGYEPMDNTHQEFVALVGAMLHCQPHDLAAHLDAFAKHAQSHFSEELAWMTQSEFPNSQCHADEHDAVLKSVHKVQSILAAGGDPAIAGRLALELSRWFPGHADYLDAALAQWLVKKKLGGVPLVLRRNMQFKA